MSKIYIESKIKAPIKRVFDLARSIDLHKISTTGTNEEAIEGKISGLINLNETVTWKAKHLGFYQTLTVKIIELESPNLFVDVMIKGTYKSMKHTHKFESFNDGTIMKDIFEFKSPLGILGEIVDILFLRNYMLKFLKTKNTVLKEVAEGEIWKELLNKNED